jgi:hypothetical protein
LPFYESACYTHIPIQKAQLRLFTMTDFMYNAKEFLNEVSFDNLLQLSSVEDLKDLKETFVCRGRCKCKNNSKFFCKPCASINRQLCRSYHEVSPMEELVLRLAYEYIFDIISEQDLANGKWKINKGRDDGHNERIRRLSALASKQMKECKWLSSR